MTTLEVAVPLPQEAKQDAFLKRLWWSSKEYAQFTGPFLVPLLLLKAINAIGYLMMFTLADRAPALLLAMTPNLAVLASTSHRLPTAAFFSLAIGRLLLADPINYWLGKRSAQFATRTNREWLLSLRKWWLLMPDRFRLPVEHFMSGLRRRMLLAVFLCTLLSLPLPIYMAAGAARTKLKWLLVVDIFATIGYVLTIYLVGFDPIASLRSCF
jgi:membrane protein YqaA with SNARE-associated domain